MTPVPTRRGADAAGSDRRTTLARATAAALLLSGIMAGAFACYSWLRPSEHRGNALIAPAPRMLPPRAMASEAALFNQRLAAASHLRDIGRASVDTAALERDLASSFPMLSNARIVCQDECVFTAKSFDETDAKYPASKLPYLGRLEEQLQQRGLSPIAGLMLEEQGGGETVLRLRFRRP